MDRLTGFRHTCIDTMAAVMGTEFSASKPLPLDLRRRVTTVFQNPILLKRSVYANVNYGLRLRGKDDLDRQPRSVLERVGLAHLAKQPARTLSGEEGQRVARARTLEGTDLKILVEGDPILFNPYGVIAVNPDKNTEINNELANTFIDWLVSLPTQELISKSGVDKFGAPLFTPDSTAWREAYGNSSANQSSDSTVALKITGKVANELSLTEADVHACSDCILSFRNQDGFSSVLPGFPGNLQVKGMIEIQVK